MEKEVKVAGVMDGYEQANRVYRGGYLPNDTSERLQRAVKGD